MVNLELKNLGVMEIDAKEMKSIDGGLFLVGFSWGSFWKGVAIGGGLGIGGYAGYQSVMC